MKCFGIIAASSVFLTTGCVPEPVSGYWRTGEAPSRLSADSTACEVAALREVPRALATAQTPAYTTPTYSTPAYTNCYGSGYGATCTTTGGQVSGGQTYGGQNYTYDANLNLRERVYGQCMAANGYSLVSLPTCETSQAQLGVTPFLSRPLPNPSQILCATDGGYVLRSAT